MALEEVSMRILAEGSKPVLSQDWSENDKLYGLIWELRHFFMEMRQFLGSPVCIEWWYWNWLWSSLDVKFKVTGTFLRFFKPQNPRKMSFSNLFRLKWNDHTTVHSHKHRQTNIQTHKIRILTHASAWLPPNSDTLFLLCKISRWRTFFTNLKFAVICQCIWLTKQKG